MYIPRGPARPDEEQVGRFWIAACTSLGDEAPARPYDVRWIGLDNETTEQVLELIVRRDKTGTFTLPWILERTGQARPRPGDPVVLIDYGGRPRVLLRLTGIEQISFGAMDSRHTAVDGAPVRDPGVWRTLHTRYWNDLLRPFGLVVSDEMPVLVERFEVLYVQGEEAGAE